MTLTATVRTDPLSVVLADDALPANTATVVVQRAVGGDRWTVRGVGDVVGTSITVVDWEVPTGADVVYLAHAYDASGGDLGTHAVTVAAAQLPDEPGWMWLSDPLDQTSGIRVHMHVGTDETRTSGRDVQVASPLGSSWPVASIGPRARLQDWTLRTILTDANRDRVIDLIESALVLCIRPAAALHLPGLLYGVAVEVSESPWHDHLSGAHPQWRSELVVKMRVTRGTELSPTVWSWTWADVAALGLTWADVLSRWQTWDGVKVGDA